MQAPFATLYIYLNETENKQEMDDLAKLANEFFEQRIQGIKAPDGSWVAQTFPKIIYVLDENNIHKDSEYYWLTEKAAECASKRLVPDFISAKIMKQLKVSKDEEKGCGDVYPAMGCRSFLTPDKSGNGWNNISKAKNYGKRKYCGGPENLTDGHNSGSKYYGRFNKGVVSINLPDIALSSKGDMDLFWKIFDERLELCHKGLKWRNDNLKGVKASCNPLLWCYGAIARLDLDEEITPLLYNGYSTLSLGYIGLYETVKYMTGKSHTHPEGREFAIKVMQHLNDACTKWNEEEDLGYSVYGTPSESLVYKFATTLQKRFPQEELLKAQRVNEGETEVYSYIQNSFHVADREVISWDQKFEKEAEFQALSPGGNISYIELPDMRNNVDAVLAVMKKGYETIMYFELNSKVCDLCYTCGSTSPMEWNNDSEKWVCPECGEDDQHKLKIVRRVCGYLGDVGNNGANRGRNNEISDRVEHFGVEMDLASMIM